MKKQSHNFSLKLWLCFWCLACSLASVRNAAQKTASPSDLYKKNCATCHNNPGNSRIPRLSTLRLVPPEATLRSLEAGARKPQAESLTIRQKRAGAKFVSGRPLQAEQNTAMGKCLAAEGPDVQDSSVWNGWGGGFSNILY